MVGSLKAILGYCKITADSAKRKNFENDQYLMQLPVRQELRGLVFEPPCM